MKAAAFDYHTPASIDEALRLLATHGDDARILAGGQSLVPAMTSRLARPAHLVDINRIPLAELPVRRANRLRIPPLMRHIDFEAGIEDGVLGALLAELARHIASLPVRLRGTFCGALAQADPASEWCLASVVLGAEMIARSSSRGVRVIPVTEFFRGMLATALADDEMLTEVQIPFLSPYATFGFNEVGVRAGVYALAMALVVYERDEDEIINVRLGVGGVEAIPRRLMDAEALLERRVPTKRLFREVAAVAAELVDPEPDAAASATWRRDLTRAVVTRALDRSLAR